MILEIHKHLEIFYTTTYVFNSIKILQLEYKDKQRHENENADDDDDDVI